MAFCLQGRKNVWSVELNYCQLWPVVIILDDLPMCLMLWQDVKFREHPPLPCHQISNLLLCSLGSGESLMRSLMGKLHRFLNTTQICLRLKSETFIWPLSTTINNSGKYNNSPFCMWNNTLSIAKSKYMLVNVSGHIC